jgi:hypothetical protein
VLPITLVSILEFKSLQVNKDLLFNANVFYLKDISNGKCKGERHKFQGLLKNQCISNITYRHLSIAPLGSIRVRDRRCNK